MHDVQGAELFRGVGGLADIALLRAYHATATGGRGAEVLRLDGLELLSQQFEVARRIIVGDVAVTKVAVGATMSCQGKGEVT